MRARAARSHGCAADAAAPAQLHGADENIGRSRRILTAMGKRAMANKVMLGAVICILIMCIALVAYAKAHK